jgi:putative transposase
MWLISAPVALEVVPVYETGARGGFDYEEDDLPRGHAEGSRVNISLEKAVAHHGKPRHRSRLAVTNFTFANTLRESGTRISMNGRGLWMDSVLSNGYGGR